MLKIIQKQLDISLIKISLIFALIYCMLFNSAVFIYKFDYYKVTAFKAILELGKDFVYIYLTLFIFFFGLTINRVVFILGSLFLFLTGALASYYLYFFRIAPTTEIIHAFFGTELNEAYELASIKLIVWLLFSIFVCIYTIRHFKLNNTSLFVTKLLSALCLLLLLNSIIAPPYRILTSYFPIQYLHNSYLYFFKAQQLSHKIDISKQFTFIDNSPQEITGVLVIGESARFDHFGINGYPRDTTPYLDSINNDLFSFKAQSCSNLTYISVPCMLSRHHSDNLAEVMQESSFLPILTQLGFDTSWIGTQSLMKYLNNANFGTIYDEVDFAIIPGGSALFNMNDHDLVMLPYIKHLLQGSKKQFLVIHTSGSHWNYAARYPEEFMQFKPGCTSTSKADPSSCNHQGLINIYDNSILYTDFFLYNVISLLKDKCAFLIYASDHAESLGENGRYSHGGELTKEQTTIPFIVWLSERFKQQRADIVKSINSHLGNEISHDYIFNSVLDCIGINSNIIDKNLSLCRAINDT